MTSVRLVLRSQTLFLYKLRKGLGILQYKSHADHQPLNGLALIGLNRQIKKWQQTRYVFLKILWFCLKTAVLSLHKLKYDWSSYPSTSTLHIWRATDWLMSSDVQYISYVMIIDITFYIMIMIFLIHIVINIIPYNFTNFELKSCYFYIHKSSNYWCSYIIC